MKIRFLVLVLLLGVPETAFAYCPHGQIRRVHLHRCVGEHSAAAREIRRYHAKITHRRRDRYFVVIGIHVRPDNTVTPPPVSPIDKPTEVELPSITGSVMSSRYSQSLSQWPQE
jgi:hypothetical protein